MAIIIILISISLTIAVFFLAVFYWNMKSGQYDDTYTPSVRMLFDDNTSRPRSQTKEGASRTRPSDRAEKVDREALTGE